MSRTSLHARVEGSSHKIRSSPDLREEMCTNNMNVLIINTILALIVVFGSVTPATVLAVDFVNITNVVQTSDHTGGKSGADGQAGADGRSGEDGKSEGVSGARVFTTSGGEGETHIKTVVNGDVVSETHNDAAQASTVRTYRWVDTTTAPSSSASDTGSTSGETVTPDTVGESAGLLEVLAELRLILKKYVSNLF